MKNEVRRPWRLLALALWAVVGVVAQTAPQPPSAPQSTRIQRRAKLRSSQLQTGKRLHLASPHNVPEGWVLITGRPGTGLVEGPWRRLHGGAELETHTQLLKADDLDYNEETGEVLANGNVYLQNFDGGDELWADRAEYNVDSETGTFYNVRGLSPVEAPRRLGILPSSNPYYFQGKWAEKRENKYILHHGFITNCDRPEPTWTVRGPLFDIIPRDRAIARNATFHVRFLAMGRVPGGDGSGKAVYRVRYLPLFFTPYYYKSLKKLPRRSGFLTPSIGNSSRRGRMLGGGYFWAINRSYDALYQSQYFSTRGFAHHLDLRGKPNQRTEFSAMLYGVNDKGLPIYGVDEKGNKVLTGRDKQGGVLANIRARSELGLGFYARTEINYLSSLIFRQAFTDTYTEAIGSEVHSIGFVGKDWSNYGLTFTVQRIENFQSNQPDDTIVIRKLPETVFSSRERRFFEKIPIWVSWDSSAGLLRRTQPAFQTRQLLERIDAYPRVSSFLHWKGFSVAPSFALRETHYGESRIGDDIIGQNIRRSAREFALDFSMPSVARVFSNRLKHVIETRATYRYVTGVDNFDELIRFDTTDLFSNTNEIEIALTNRLYAKRANGEVNEILSWDLRQKRYFDPSFGGAIVEGQRNVLWSSISLTPYAFLDGRRRYSPVVSTLRASPRPGFGVEWRSDFDPLRRTVVNNTISAFTSFGPYLVMLGHDTVRKVPGLSPSSNQFNGQFRVGNDTRRGWNAAFSWIYDFREGVMRNAVTQVTYNTECCGVSFQYHRYSGPLRAENQFRVSFAVANIATFGTLKRQDRLF